jgi:DNA-binding Xre family transcriptional regulator
MLFQEVLVMAMNYQKLWMLLKERKLKKKDLREMAGLSTNVIAKMGKGGDVSTEVLRKICKVLNCTLDDIVEISS